MANLPLLNFNYKIAVICEGFEDTAYFKRLLKLNVWSERYSFHPINARSATNIPATFQDTYQNDKYDLILIFCDTDKEPYREYSRIKREINAFFNKRKASEKLIIFANPCTMQIILSHFGDVSLTKQGKRTNAEIIEKWTGVKNYDAHEDQINEICNKIYYRSYSEMKRRVDAINLPDTTPCSTNFIIFLDLFEKDDTKWIEEINKYLQGN